MTTNTSSATLLGSHAQVDIRSIERELTELWKSAAQGDEEQRGAVTRACTLNLVAVSYGATAQRAVDQAIDRLTGTHPHRAIVLSIEDGGAAGQAPIEAWVQAHCQIPAPGRPQVCCEQITITARDTGVMRIPGTLLPLLVSDVPVVVWYPEGEPFGDPLYERLQELADRVVVDTEQFVDPEGGLRRLAALTGGATPASDLAWGRLTIWRELIAQCFDAPALAGRLPAIDRVRIAYGSHCSRVPALLLAGWMSARLGWRLVGRSGPTEATILRMARPAGGETLIEVRRSYTADELAAHLASVEIQCADLRVLVGPGDRSGMLLTRIEASGRPALLRSARWQRPDTPDLLAAELRLLNRDTPYEDVLRVTASLIGV